MAKKFDPIRTLVAELEGRAAKLDRLKVVTTVSSNDDVAVQITAIKAMFRRLKINHRVTAKIGLWKKRMPVVDVIVDFQEMDRACRNGEEAFEMSTLMKRAFDAVRRIMHHTLPGVNAFCPEVGITVNGWRFQC